MANRDTIIFRMPEGERRNVRNALAILGLSRRGACELDCKVQSSDVNSDDVEQCVLPFQTLDEFRDAWHAFTEAVQDLEGAAASDVAEAGGLRALTRVLLQELQDNVLLLQQLDMEKGTAQE